MKKKLKRIFVIFFAAGVVLGWVGVHFIAPYALIKPSRVSLKIVPADYGVKGEKVMLTTKDDIELVGYHVNAESSQTRGVLILVHGVGGCKEHFVALGAKLAKQGIASVLFDERAHGESGGEYCTYGYYEKQDIKEIVDYVKSKYTDVPLGIMGNSLGGAVAIQALETDTRIEFGIIESTFTNLHQIAFDYKKRILKGFGIRFISDYALKRAGIIADFDPYQVQPIQSVQNIEQPVFIAHGDADQRISITYGKALFDNLKSTDKTWYVIQGGTHMNLSTKGGDLYEEALWGFLEQHITPEVLIE